MLLECVDEDLGEGFRGLVGRSSVAGESQTGNGRRPRQGARQLSKRAGGRQVEPQISRPSGNQRRRQMGNRARALHRIRRPGGVGSHRTGGGHPRESSFRTAGSRSAARHRARRDAQTEHAASAREYKRHKQKPGLALPRHGCIILESRNYVLRQPPADKRAVSQAGGS